MKRYQNYKTKILKSKKKYSIICPVETCSRGNLSLVGMCHSSFEASRNYLFEVTLSIILIYNIAIKKLRNEVAP